MPDREMSDTTIQDFLDGLTDRVQSHTGAWRPYVAFYGDTDRAGTADHDGEVIHIEDAERRLKAHKEEHGDVDGIEAVELTIRSTDKPDFEDEPRIRHDGTN
jgi:hypothetical protein